MMKKRFTKWALPEFDKNYMTKWGWKCQHPNNLKLGKNVDIGTFCYLNAKYGITLEDCVQIGSHTSLYSISTIDDKKGPIIVGKNARIGSHSLVMPGVKIGKDAVIGAFSFVNKDIPAGSIAWGVPVKIIRKGIRKK